jgi:hypothetical protein
LEYKILTESGFGSKTGVGDVKKWERAEGRTRRGPDMDMEIEEDDMEWLDEAHSAEWISRILKGSGRALAFPQIRNFSPPFHVAG